MKFRRQSMEKELTTIMWTRMAAEGMKDFGNEIAGQEWQAGISGNSQWVRAYYRPGGPKIGLSSRLKPGIDNNKIKLDLEPVLLKLIWKQHFSIWHSTRRFTSSRANGTQCCPDHSSSPSDVEEEGIFRYWWSQPSLGPSQAHQKHQKSWFALPGCAVEQAFSFWTSCMEAIQ